MAEVAQAELRVVPKFTGFKEAVEAEVGRAERTAQARGQGFGTKFGDGAKGGLVKSGAVVGAFAAVTNKAMSSVADHVGAAVSRFDTLNNYPKVMTQLGYSAEAADASINKMSDRLQGLPTTLDSMVGLVQGLVTNTNDLEKATDVGLALNDMLVASGSSTQLTNAAMEQFRQILSKGKPELEDWKSLTSAMPGQMDQLAKSMLGPKANANDLYAALGGGKNKATISLDQLMGKMVELDQKGGKGLSSFQSQAETAAGGVATSMANMGNAVSRGITGVLDAIGKENIAGFFDDMKGGINAAFGAVQSFVKAATPGLLAAYGAAKQLAPQVAATAAVFGTAMVAGDKLVPVVGRLAEALRLAKGGAGTLAESMGAVGFAVNPATLAIAAGSVAVVGLGTAVMGYVESTQNAEKATKGLADATSRLTGLDEYGGIVTSAGNAASFTALSVTELNKVLAEHAELMGKAADESESEIGKLNYAQAAIGQFAGKTKLTTEQQGKLKGALGTVNSALGTHITKQDVAAGKYRDQDGKVKDLVKSLDKLIAKKREEVRQDALSEQYKTSYDDYAKSCDTLAESEQRLARAKEARDQAEQNALPNLQDYDIAVQAAEADVRKATESNEAAKSSLNSIEKAMGETTKATSENASAWDRWGSDFDQKFVSRLNAATDSKSGVATLKQQLEALGVSGDDLPRLTKHMDELTTSWDGDVGSLIPLLEEWGVKIDGAKAKAAQAADGIRESFGDMGITDSLEAAGIDVQAFSDKLADAGVSADQLNAVGSENLSALAQSCNGDLSSMVAAIVAFNGTDLLSKDGEVSVDDVELTDAQGRVVRWNGTAFVDKETSAVVKDGELTDAQGRVYKWNGTKLVSKNGKANASGNVIGGKATNDVNKFTAAANKVPKEKSTTVKASVDKGPLDSFLDALASIPRSITTALSTTHHAAGGIRPHADGGIVPRYHASGAIATKAVPLDIVGEDGAEAIVPLTNERYSRPFADLIARSVNEGRGTTQSITINLNYSADADANQMVRDIALGLRRLQMTGA